MKDGFFKVAAACPVIKVADCKGNAFVIIDAIKNAAEKGARLVVFPEMTVCSASVGELVRNRALLKSSEDAILKIRNATEGSDTLAVVGFPFALNGSLYNCAAVIQNGNVLGIVPKTSISCFGESYDARYLHPHRRIMPRCSSEVK